MTTSISWALDPEAAIVDIHDPLSWGQKGMVELLGSKGTGLVDMARLGLPVPPAFILTTRVCQAYYQSAHPDEVLEALRLPVLQALKQLETQTGKTFGDPHNPLLLSVRSGAQASMPGMMDTVLNVGMTQEICQGLGNSPFAKDTLERFLEGYARVVLDHSSLDKASLIKTDVFKQLWGSIQGVLNSWMSARAVAYRRFYHIPDTGGTAVILQAMVFGNGGPDCATGVMFTRNPSTGDKRLFGEYLPNAQGEDIVSGQRTPYPLRGEALPALEVAYPALYSQLCYLATQLEAHYRDMQDIEFTLERGKIWLLQTRTAKRTFEAALKVAQDMVHEGLISCQQALARLDISGGIPLLHAQLENRAGLTLLGKGMAASPGAATGKLALSSEACQKFTDAGEDVILARHETSSEDVRAMMMAKGVVTACGGMTSHAAVVARGAGIPCVTGMDALTLTPSAIRVGTMEVQEGGYLTLDGATGEVFAGQGQCSQPAVSNALETILQWADEQRQLKVYANAETPQDITAALSFGAEGIGLCRSEHMFFQPDRLQAFRRLLLAASAEEKHKALEHLLPLQQEDFYALMVAAQGKVLTVRLLDPPLHEFLPPEDLPHGGADLAVGLREVNPMLGHRGCRLGMTTPEIYDMQVKALFRAATQALNEGLLVTLDVLIPLITWPEEFVRLKRRIVDMGKALLPAAFFYNIGAMIEVPAAALCAGALAQHADFLSFGTNDLTQTTLGLSRDDSHRFLTPYLQTGVILQNPFQHLDTRVGQLIQQACQQARLVNPSIKLGVCGEHGADAASIQLFQQLEMAYISCSPYRIPAARIAAAQAVNPTP